MSSFTLNIAKARTLSIGLGLLATSVPVFAQATGAPATPATPVAEVAPLPVPATDPQAKALFDQSVARYATLKNLTVTHNDSKLIQFSAPSTAKVTTRDAKGDISVVQVYNDAETIVMQKPNDVFEYISVPRPALAEGKTARSRMATTGIGGIAFPKLLAGVSPVGEDSAYKASSYTMAAPITLDGVPVVPVTVTTIKGDKQPFDLTYVFYIGQNDKLVHKIEAKVAPTNGGEVRTITDTFTNYKVDADAPADTFAFTAPADAVKVTEFTRPTMRAKVGELPLALPAGAKDIDGKAISFDQFKGKVTLVDFWATWCGPCIGELPNVKANYDKYKGQGFDVLGISLDQSTPPLTKFIQEKEMPWRQVFDGYWDGPIATSYNVKAIPATILIGKDGKIAAIGARGEALEPAIKAALAAG